MSDEEMYLEATNEVEGGQKDPALWAKVMALAEGNQEKAKYQYIKLRVEQLANNKAEEKLSSVTKTSGNEYISVEIFSELKGITKKKAIAMIKEGFYDGRLIDGKWHVVISDEEKVNPSMKEWHVYEKEGDKVEIVKDGFNWWAFWFVGIWAISRNLYMAGFIGITMALAINRIPPLPIDLEFIVFLIPVCFMLVYGLHGNSWVCSKLEKNGFHLRSKIKAASKEDAMAMYIAMNES